MCLPLSLCSKSAAEEPKNIENQGFEDPRSPLKVVTEVGIPLGMLSTNIGLTKLEGTRSIESRMWAVEWLKVDDVLKMSCFGLFWSTLLSLIGVSDKNSSLIDWVPTQKAAHIHLL